MSGNTIGKLFTVTTFGESHGPALGCIVDGCPPGLELSEADLQRMVSAVPDSAAAALHRKAYYFVPLTINQGDDTMIADRYDVALSDNAVCHRNLELGDSHCVFISTRRMDDKFSVAFEFYINVGHAVVERASVSREFADVVWKQVESNARGETCAIARRRSSRSRSRKPIEARRTSR